MARNKIYAELIRNYKRYRIKSLYGNKLEVNFGAMTNNVEKLKKKMLTIISLVDARMKSRFLRGTYLPTMNIIASSKSSDLSFLDSYIDTKKKNESKNTLIVDEPQWVVDSRKDSPEHFLVAVGNKFLSNELLPKNSPDDLVHEYRAKGYQLLSVPIGYWDNFADNIDGALTDIAGISTASSLKYISGMRWNEVKVDSYKNPFVKEIIEVGTGSDDTAQYYDYFDLTRVTPELMAKPLFVHLDMSKSGDKTGIAGVYVIGKKPKVEGLDASRELFYQVAFNVSIKAPKGREISFDKNRAFIRWLRDSGFNIYSISCDTYNSAQIQLQLTADGFDVQTISVDRLDNNSKILLQYAYFKSTLYDKRISVYRDCDLLTDEVIGLERESDGHILHPMLGTLGCFTGDTKISLVDGRELTLLELVDEYNLGKQNYVYSFNENKKIIEPKLIEKAWCTIKDAKLVDICLDNGEILRCTPNHKFMLKDGAYKEAQYLTTDDSLMPLYRRYPDEVLCERKNHRIISVKFLDYTEDVYDLTILDNHNFALTAGIFVHNSKDAIDAVVGSTYNASLHAEELAYNSGESLDSTLESNLDDTPAGYEEHRKQIEIDMEELLKGLYQPKEVYVEDDYFKDFGLGAAKLLYNELYDISNGIIC